MNDGDCPDQIAALREALVSWERLRLVYNGAMLLVGLPVALILALPLHPAVGFLNALILAVAFGAAANACYFLGPLLELYVGIIRGRPFTRTTRMAFFVAGLLVSVAVIGAVFALGYDMWQLQVELAG